jgi:hypothetical protein
MLSFKSLFPSNCFIILLLLANYLSLNACYFRENKHLKKLKTHAFGGLYSYGTIAQKGRVGCLTVYPETDTTLLFTLDLNIGEPAYNNGFTGGRLKLVNNQAMVSDSSFISNTNCQWTIVFNNDTAILKTINERTNCGFGARVFVDGKYIRKNKKISHYFINPENEKTYFKKGLGY